MTSFTFTAEQLRLAPPEVRRWAVQEIAQALAAAERPSHDPSQVRAAALAACTEEEALHVFGMIRTNFVLAQVFFELARDAVPGTRVPPLHPLNTGDILRHTRLAHSDGLLQCFNVINDAFQQIRCDPEASLFGFDGYGHVYIHDATHLSIRRLLEELVRPHPAATGGAAPSATPSTADLSAPEFGRREDVLRDRAEPAAGESSVKAAQPAGNSQTESKFGETRAASAPTSTPTSSASVQAAAEASKAAPGTGTRPMASANVAEKVNKMNKTPRQRKAHARSVGVPATTQTHRAKITAQPTIGQRKRARSKAPAG